MCGIVAYIGNKNAYPILIEGLQRLEYRGYDSAGIALMTNKIDVFKKKGKVQSFAFIGFKVPGSNIQSFMFND